MRIPDPGDIWWCLLCTKAISCQTDVSAFLLIKCLLVALFSFTVPSTSSFVYCKQTSSNNLLQQRGKLSAFCLKYLHFIYLKCFVVEGVK